MTQSSRIEIDFFRLADESSLRKSSERRDIQGVVSKINPELLKTAIASASAKTSFVHNKAVNMPPSVAPMSIFFNGTVSVFDVTPSQAESIMKLAESAKSVSRPDVERALLVKPERYPNQAISGVIRDDLPLSRKRSLRRFLEKRKERQVCTSPYACSEGSTSLH